MIFVIGELDSSGSTNGSDSVDNATPGNVDKGRYMYHKAGIF